MFACEIRTLWNKNPRHTNRAVATRYPLYDCIGKPGRRGRLRLAVKRRNNVQLCRPLASGRENTRSRCWGKCRGKHYRHAHCNGLSHKLQQANPAWQLLDTIEPDRPPRILGTTGVQMNAVFTIPVMLVIALFGAVFASSLAIYAMIGEVNRKLPDDQQIEYLFMYPGKVSKVKLEYKRLYPKGRLPLLWNLTVGVMIALGLAVAWSIGFFH